MLAELRFKPSAWKDRPKGDLEKMFSKIKKLVENKGVIGAPYVARRCVRILENEALQTKQHLEGDEILARPRKFRKVARPAEPVRL